MTTKILLEFNFEKFFAQWLKNKGFTVKNVEAYGSIHAKVYFTIEEDLTEQQKETAHTLLPLGMIEVSFEDL